jgi:S1-C subfamily serine protease
MDEQEPESPKDELPAPKEEFPAPKDELPAEASGGLTGWWGDPAPTSTWPQFPSPPPALPPAPPSSATRRTRTVLAAVLAGLVLLGGGFGIGWGLTRGGTVGGPQVVQAPIGTVPQPTTTSNGSGQQLSLSAIRDKVNPSVVDVVSIFDPSTLGSSGGNGSQAERQGAGTGMILTSSGEVLTNNHVVEGATSLEVTIQGHSGKYSAEVVGVDPTDDVALIQIEGVSGLPTVTLADSSRLIEGQRVVAIGNALGRGGEPAATEGTITGLNRSITAGGGSSTPEHLTGLIETNASISPGDSGGPLVNGSGQVIGMITASARVNRFQPTSNEGYAISSNAALGVVNLIRTGQPGSDIILGKAGFLGVEIRDLDQQTASQLGVSSGALVAGVLAGTPAAKAGLSRNSVITAVDGQTVSSADALGPILHAHKPGEQVRVTWVDGSGTHTATVTLIAGPAV